MTPSEVTVRRAATVALLRDAPDGLQVFLLRRHPNHVFGASAYVYPGGALDTADADLRLHARYGADCAAAARAALGADDALAYWVAGARECFEEAGVLVGCDIGRPPSGADLAAARDDLNAGTLAWVDLAERLDLRFNTQQLQYFAHWTTPAGPPKRYSTRFFAARMPGSQKAIPDGLETTHGQWLRPQQALQRQRNGDIQLMHPTQATLELLAGFTDADTALSDLHNAAAPARWVRRRRPAGWTRSCPACAG